MPAVVLGYIFAYPIAGLAFLAAGWIILTHLWIFLISLPRLRRRLATAEKELALLKQSSGQEPSAVPTAPQQMASEQGPPVQKYPITQKQPTSPIETATAISSTIAATSISQASPSAGAVLSPASPASKPPIKSASISWEQFTGVNLFAWLGGLILFLGVAFFLKYSIDNALISPAMRVTLGFLAGVSALVGGSWLALKKHSVSALSLCATGVLILYADTFAARALYHLIPAELAFGLMILVSAVAFTLAIRFSAQIIALLGLTGAFLTPVLISTGSGSLVGLSVYIFILNFAIFAITYYRKWDWLLLLAGIGTILLDLAWMSDYLSSATSNTLTLVLTLASVFFSVAYERLAARHGRAIWAQLASVIVPCASLLIGWYLTTVLPFTDRPFWLFAAMLVIDACLLWPLFVRSNWGWTQSLAGLLTFILLSIWSIDASSTHIENNLYVLLGSYFVFTLLHSIGPVLLQRLRPQVGFVRLNAIFPLLGMAMAAIPLLRVTELSMAVWPVFALIMFIGLLMAALLGSFLTMLAVIFVGGLCAVIWMVFHNFLLAIHANSVIASAVNETLIVIGGMALLLLGFSVILYRAFSRNASFLPKQSERMTRWLPALSGALPFLLLCLLVTQRGLQDNLAILSSIFGLGLLILILMLGTGNYLRAEGTNLVAAVSSFALLEAWYLDSLRFNLYWLAPFGLFWCLLYYGVQTLAPFALNLKRSTSSLGWIAQAIAGPLFFCIVYPIIRKAYPNPYMGLVPAAFAVAPLATIAYLLRANSRVVALKGAVCTKQTEGAELGCEASITSSGNWCEASVYPHGSGLAWLGGVALLMITLIFPAQFEKNWLTVAWALEAAALIWLYQKLRVTGLAWTGLALGITAFMRLACNPWVFDSAMHTALPILNWYLYTYGVAIASFFAAAWIIRRDVAFQEKKPFRTLSAAGLFDTMAVLLLFLLLNIEIADYFSAKEELRFRFMGSAGTVSSGFAEGMTYSIAWALFALGLVVVGIRKNIRFARYSGMLLIGATTLKLLLFDFTALRQLYRVGATVGVALVLIFMSFIYNMFFTSKSHDTPHE